MVVGQSHFKNMSFYVKCPVTNLCRFLFTLNSSTVLAVDGPNREPSTCLGPTVGSLYLMEMMLKNDSKLMT
jgi:hypothetical protein